jgi:hypothetical protein
LVGASTWKNNFQLLFGKKLDELYKLMKPLPNHMLDAHLQAIFGIKRFRGVDPSFIYSGWRLDMARKLMKFIPEKKVKKK